MELKEEINQLEKQKHDLLLEIDSLESKLKNLHEFNVDGKITLQCGTQTSINPQFHLKIDPNARLDYSGIFAAFGSRSQQLQFGESNIRTPVGNIYTEFQMRLIPLWTRENRFSLD